MHFDKHSFARAIRSSSRLFLILFLFSFVLFVGCKDGGCSGCSSKKLLAAKMSVVNEYATKIPSDVNSSLFVKEFGPKTSRFFDGNEDVIRKKFVKSVVMETPLKFLEDTTLDMRDLKAISASGLSVKDGFAMASWKRGSKIFLFKVDDLTKVKKNLVPKWVGKGKSQEATFGKGKATVSHGDGETQRAWILSKDFVTLFVTQEKGDPEELLPDYFNGPEKKKGAEKSPPIFLADSPAFTKFTKKVAADFPISIYYGIPDEVPSKLGSLATLPGAAFPLSPTSLGDKALKALDFVGWGTKREKGTDHDTVYIGLSEEGQKKYGDLVGSHGKINLAPYVTTDMIFGSRFSFDPQAAMKAYLDTDREAQSPEDVAQRKAFAYFADRVTGQGALFFYGLVGGPLAGMQLMQGGDNTTNLLALSAYIQFKSNDALDQFVAYIQTDEFKSLEKEFSGVRVAEIEGTGVRKVEGIDSVSLYAYKDKLMITSLAIKPDAAVSVIKSDDKEIPFKPEEGYPRAKAFFDGEVQNGFFFSVPAFVENLGPLLSPLTSMNSEVTEIYNQFIRYSEIDVESNYKEGGLRIDLYVTTVK